MPFPEPDLPTSPVTDPTIIDSHAIFGEDEEDTDADGESDEVQGDHHMRATPISIVSPAPISPPVPDPRRLFQRLWTDDDEILILEGFLEFTSQRGTTGHAHQHDTGPFYERIRSQVELDFSKSQLVEKLRRLKKKFRTNMAKMSSGNGTGKEAFFAFKSAHDRKAYEISEKIWGGGLDSRKCDDGIGDGGKIRKRGRKSGEVGLEVKVEETATTSSAVLAVAAASEILKMDPPMVEDCVGAGLSERWRQQQILELEVYSKRLELIQEEIKDTLVKLRSGR